jgi:anion-transporting  ArsA/GET3 family ATPase
MFRGYDTSTLHWKDEILQIRHLEAEIADMQKEIDRQKEKAVAAMERLERTKKWLGIID